MYEDQSQQWPGTSQQIQDQQHGDWEPKTNGGVCQQISSSWSWSTSWCVKGWSDVLTKDMQVAEKNLTAPGIPRQSPIQITNQAWRCLTSDIRPVQSSVAVSNIHCDTYLSYMCWNHMFPLFYQIIGLRGWCWSCICSSLMCLFFATGNDSQIT